MFYRETQTCKNNISRHFEVERLIFKKIVKNEVTFFLLYDCCLFLKVKIVNVVAIISFLMPPYVKNKTKCTLILELILTSVSDQY
jgi:hypothetical protein